MKQEINKKALLVQQEITAFEFRVEKKYILVWMSEWKTGYKGITDIGIRQIMQNISILIYEKLLQQIIVLMKNNIILIFDVPMVKKLQLINGRNFIQ